jgi:cytochrome P450
LTKPTPEDKEITLRQLHADPYPIYKRLRQHAPVLRVKALNRTLLTKAADTRFVKDTPEIFSSDDPNTPMERAFRAKTLMRKDGQAHLSSRQAMMPAFAPRVIKEDWLPKYRDIATRYVDRLPRGEIIDLFSGLAGPYAAAGLGHLLGIQSATDEELQRWSQRLIDGAGNFGWLDGPFEKSDQANDEMDRLIGQHADLLREAPDNSALSVMVNAENPIPYEQIVSNIKIAIGGGINEPRDAMLTTVAGLLANPDQRRQVQENGDWTQAFEEAIRWVAPIQVSARRVLEDTEIRGFILPKGDVVMTSQASACRDEDIYGDGEGFDVYRPKAPHQAFGNGPHFCMGTHVARKAVGEILLPILFDRFPKLLLPRAEDVVWHGFAFRGPTVLPVLLN